MSHILEHYMKALTEGLPEAVWAFDRDYKLRVGNAAFLDLRASLYGFDLKPGDDFFKGVPENVIQKWIPYYSEVFEGKRLILDDLRNVNGRFQQVRITLNPVYDENEKIVACMGITIDTSAEYDLENQIKQIKSSVSDLTRKFRGPLKQSLEKLFNWEDQLTHQTMLKGSEKEEIIRLASYELQTINSYLQDLLKLDNLVK